ncbi:SDR family oxidoreductase [Streptomyces sp. NBC_01485]|uniref:SDR family NAD(P)-dependent oxidoreductase n=1 Tax=Streptomyces sp. NBC_01485 TaxID=2903884 RepID=UPI002E3590A6|nr:SDR family oxidoreductase [Streptomyces sp. NBC_01485]
MSNASEKPVALVTGAGRGIGRATAALLAERGYSIVAVDQDESAETTARSVGGTGVRCDVRDAAGLRSLAAGLDRLDLLVNNAGVWTFSSLEEIDVEHFRRVLDVNVLGNLICTQIFAPIIARSGGGAIVNVTSFLAETARANSGVYPAAKAAIIALTKQAAIEYADAGIRVNAVGPGLIRTEGAANLFGPDPAEHARRGAYLPLGRLGEADDIAGVIAFLGSAEARYVTGQTLYADGGIGVGTMRFLHQAWTP